MAASDGVRIVDIIDVGDRDDLVSENFVVIDGENGTKKVPANYVRGDLCVFSVSYNTQQDTYTWPDWDKVQDAILGGAMVALKLSVLGNITYYVSTGRGTELNDQDETIMVYEFLDVTTGDNIVVKYNNDTETWGTPVFGEHIPPGSLKGGSTLTDAASVDIGNNKLHRLTTAQSALTLNVVLNSSGEVPNFAVEITAGAAVTLTVTKTVGSTTTTLKQSVAGGNELESGKFYQLTCVGSCWTVAEFEQPSS